MKLNGDTSADNYLSDEKIVELYWQREEKAIEETDKKYGKYLYTIAYNIVHDKLDSEECLNDTYLGTWNSIPPARPSALQIFVSKIARGVAVNKFKSKTAKKRIPSELVTSLSELDECIPYDTRWRQSARRRSLAGLLATICGALTTKKPRCSFADTTIPIR